MTSPAVSHRFLRAQHLRRRDDFLETQRRGQRSQDFCFTVYGRTNGLSLTRLGVTVSRKVSTRAVVRNRIKRQIRESFRACQNDVPGLDLVVIARGAAAGVTGLKLRDSLQHHWNTQKKSCVRC